MNILNVNVSADLISGGGAAERNIQMSRHLAINGHKCTILSTGLGMTKGKIAFIKSLNIKLVLLPSIWNRFYIPKVNFYKLNMLIKQQDVIHLMNQWSFLNILVFFFARLNHVPYVICPAGSLNIYGRSRMLKILFNYFIGYKIIKLSSAIIACSDSEFNFFKKCGFNAKKITIIPNGINFDDYMIRNNLFFHNHFKIPKKPFILFMGRLNKIKGPDLLLNAYIKICNSVNYNLVFAGYDEGMLSDLKKIVISHKLSNKIFFIGHVSGKLKFYAYQACKFVAIPSHSDPLPLVLLEAAAAKKPCLITDKCGFPEIKSIKGGLITKDDKRGVKKGLLEIIHRLESDKTMGINLYQYTYKKFSWANVVNNYINLYSDILSMKKTN